MQPSSIELLIAAVERDDRAEIAHLLQAGVDINGSEGRWLKGVITPLIAAMISKGYAFL